MNEIKAGYINSKPEFKSEIERAFGKPGKSVKVQAGRYLLWDGRFLWEIGKSWGEWQMREVGNVDNCSPLVSRKADIIEHIEIQMAAWELEATA